MDQETLVVNHRNERPDFFAKSFSVLGVIMGTCQIFADWKTHCMGLLLIASMALVAIILFSVFAALQNHTYTFLDDCIEEKISKHNFLSLTVKKTIRIPFDDIASIVTGRRIMDLYGSPDRYIQIQKNNLENIKIFESDRFAHANETIDYDTFIERLGNYWSCHGLAFGADVAEEEDSFFGEGAEVFVDENGQFVDSNGNSFEEDHDDDHPVPSIPAEGAFEIPEDNTSDGNRILWTIFCVFVVIFYGYKLNKYFWHYAETNQVDGQVYISIFCFLLFGGALYRQLFGHD